MFVFSLHLLISSLIISIHFISNHSLHLSSCILFSCLFSLSLSHPVSCLSVLSLLFMFCHLFKSFLFVFFSLYTLSNLFVGRRLFSSLHFPSLIFSSLYMALHFYLLHVYSVLFDSCHVSSCFSFCQLSNLHFIIL